MYIHLWTGSSNHPQLKQPSSLFTGKFQCWHSPLAITRNHPVSSIQMPERPKYESGEGKLTMQSPLAQLPMLPSLLQVAPEGSFRILSLALSHSEYRYQADIKLKNTGNNIQ